MKFFNLNNKKMTAQLFGGLVFLFSGAMAHAELCYHLTPNLGAEDGNALCIKKSSGFDQKDTFVFGTLYKYSDDIVPIDTLSLLNLKIDTQDNPPLVTGVLLDPLNGDMKANLSIRKLSDTNFEIKIADKVLGADRSFLGTTDQIGGAPQPIGGNQNPPKGLFERLGLINQP